jgi:tRNA(Ile)-lysidine synthase
MPDLAALLAAALGRPLGAAERVAVAVSGGPDSVALLLLAAETWPGRVIALTVDHRLRPAGAAEAADVARQCAVAGIPHATLAWEQPASGPGLQAAARAARYELLANGCAAAGIGVLMTAHHRDDQAETLLMRLARGSGSTGLAGIRPCRDLGQGVMLVRPLLGVPRAMLADIAAASGWALVDDPSNRDPAYARTAARALLAATPWLDAARLADSAAHVAADSAALHWVADHAWAGRATVAGENVALDAGGLPAALVRRLVARAILAVSPTAKLRGPALARLIAALDAGRTATLAGVRGRGGALWRFDPAPKRRENSPNCPESR